MSSSRIKKKIKKETPTDRLFKAVENESLEDAVSALVEGADINGLNSDEWTPLMIAILGGQIDMVKFLLNNGAALKGFYLSGNNMEMLQLLLKRGAKINEKDPHTGTTVLLQIIDDNYENQEELETIKFLIKRGANPNLKDKSGINATMQAAAIGHDKVLRYLIQNGAHF